MAGSPAFSRALLGHWVQVATAGSLHRKESLRVLSNSKSQVRKRLPSQRPWVPFPCEQNVETD